MDARHERIKAVFDVLNTNSNGYLESIDLETAARRIIRDLGVDPGSAPARTYLDSITGYWTSLVSELDQNNDGRLSFDEFARPHTPANYPSAVRPLAESLAQLCDLDQDGFIEHTDFVTAALGIGFPRAAAETFYAELDTSREGRIPTGAFLTMFENFLLAETRTAGQTLVPN
ncbi:hypothetical protein GCM10009850_122100 [Nonomuraea monospora]|uniref:EF-hand domain-containing protein n=1 Tax=Nonomuraea monospora TaxID=568818 RepID=A0ABP5PZ97_9ACTN